MAAGNFTVFAEAFGRASWMEASIIRVQHEPGETDASANHAHHEPALGLVCRLWRVLAVELIHAAVGGQVIDALLLRQLYLSYLYWKQMGAREPGRRLRRNSQAGRDRRQRMKPHGHVAETDASRSVRAVSLASHRNATMYVLCRSTLVAVGAVPRFSQPSTDLLCPPVKAKTGTVCAVVHGFRSFGGASDCEVRNVCASSMSGNSSRRVDRPTQPVISGGRLNREKEKSSASLTL